MREMDDNVLRRMREIFEGIDNAVLMCKDPGERLMMACCMIQKTAEMYDEILGPDGRRIMFLEVAMR